jgi:hypothetical protein
MCVWPLQPRSEHTEGPKATVAKMSDGWWVVGGTHMRPAPRRTTDERRVVVVGGTHMRPAPRRTTPRTNGSFSMALIALVHPLNTLAESELTG